MSRIPPEVVELDFGEDAVYAPPPEADRWSAFRHSAVMPAMSESGFGNANITYGGAPPQWVIIGGWDVAADTYIPPPSTVGQPCADVTGFEDIASAAGFTVTWNTIAAATAGGLREVLMVIAYADGKAFRRAVYRAPASSAIDPVVIAVQERRLLQSLLLARDSRAGAGGIIKIEHGEGSGEEYESLAVLDRRISECRARIAWFEQAAEGNDLPAAVYW